MDPASFNISVDPMSINIATTEQTVVLLYPGDKKKFAKKFRAFQHILKGVYVTVVQKGREGISTIHEQQHVIFKLFQAARTSYDRNLSSDIFKTCIKEHDPDIKNRLTNQYLSIHIKYILDICADEILALKASNDNWIFTPDQNGNFPFTSYYDFWTENTNPFDYERLGISQGQMSKAEKEYEKNILSASSAYDSLRISLNISRDQVNKLLMDYPLADWPKIASRQIESHHARNLNNQNKRNLIPKFLQNFTSLNRLKEKSVAKE